VSRRLPRPLELTLVITLLASTGCLDDRAEIDADHQRADRLFEEARYREAAELYRSVVGRDPEREGTRDRLAESLALGGREAAAVLQYKALIDERPGEAKLRIAIGDLHWKMGRPDLARQAFRAAADTPPGSVEGLTRLIRLELEEDPGAAVKLAAQGLGINPGNLELRLLQARAHRAAGDAARARNLLSAIQQAAPEDPRLLLALAESAEADGKSGEAVRLFERAVRAGGQDPRPCIGLGRATLAQGEIGKARHAFEAALSRSPGQREASLGLIDALLVAGELERAALQTQKLLDRRRSDAEGFLRQAIVREATGDTQGALAAYQRAAVLAPDSAEMHFRYGRGLARAGADATASAELERALAVKPDLAEAACLLGAIQARSRLDRVRGREVLRSALEKTPDSARCWLALALLEESVGRIPEALLAAQKARRLAPGDPDIVGDLRRLQGEFDRRARPIGAIAP